MIMMIVRNAPLKCKGYIKNTLVEIDSNVFVGDISARVRDALWDFVVNHKCDAIIVWDEQGCMRHKSRGKFVLKAGFLFNIKPPRGG